MNVTLRPDLQEFVAQKLRSGQYATMEELVQAGLAALKQQETFGDFAPGQLDALLADGEKSLRASEPLDPDSALAARRARRSSHRNEQG